MLLAEELLRSPVVLGVHSAPSAVARASGADPSGVAQSPFTNDELSIKDQIIASNKTWAWELVVARAKHAKRRVSAKEVLGEAPAADFLISTPTPQKKTSDDEYLQRVIEAVEDFNWTILRGNKHASTRLANWNSANGRLVRSDQHIRPEWIAFDAARAKCFICRTRSVGQRIC